MNIKELKEQIENKTLDDSFLVLKCADNYFIAQQYADEIARFKHLEKVCVDKIEECSHISSIFGQENSNELFVLITDKFETDIINLPDYKNTIVICKEIDGVAHLACNSDKVISIPKLEDWQIKAYLQMKCSGLDDAEINWLYDISKGDVYRLTNEIDKLCIFNKDEQEQIFNLINEDNGYVDLSPLTIFNFINAIIKKDYKMLNNVLTDIENIDVEGTGVVTLLHKNIKQIIDIKLNSKATPETLGISLKQFKAIEYNCNNFTDEQLINIFQFLTSIDMKLKSGNLQFSTNTKEQNRILVNYLVCNVLGA